MNRFFSILGGPATRTVLVSLATLSLLLRGRRWSAAMLVTATGGMSIINTALKNVVRRRRPQGLPGKKQAGGFSFPSGHASGSFVFFGSLGILLGYVTRHRAIALVSLLSAGIVTGYVGQSRIVRRAHYRSDVLGGYLLGALWLGLIARVFAHPLTREQGQIQ